MRRGITIASVFLLLIAFAPAADEDQRVALNFLNMIPGGERCVVKLDGKSINPEGLPAGVETGWFSIPAGRIKITAEHPDGTVLSHTLASEGLPAQICVIYLEAGKPGDSGAERSAKLRIMVFSAFKAGSGVRKLVSLCREEIAVLIGANEIALKSLEPIDATVWNEAGFTVKHQQKNIGEIGESMEKSNYYLFVSQGSRGTFLASAANADRLDTGR